MSVRTTLNLADGLVEAAKSRARRDGRTLTSVIEDGLRLVLDESAPDPDADPTPLPTFGVREGRFLVDILDRDALADAFDADDPTRADSPGR
jgi:hypothetical protein